MRLATLLGRDDAKLSREVTGLALDSRAVRAGDAFLACVGARSHGLDHLDQALARGAAAVLWEPAPGRSAPELPGDVPAVPVPALAARASELADRFYGEPSRALRVLGITGTNGKTTCAWLLAQALELAGRPCAYIGTLGAGRHGEIVAGTHTTPDAVSLQRLLAGFRDGGATHIAMEVSSHALVQRRAAAVRFTAAAVTNLTRDHLDYHGTMENYAAAKASLFESDGLALRVVNADDDFGRSLLARHADALAVSAAGQRHDVAHRPWLAATQVRLTDDGASLRVASSFGEATVRTALLGQFNVQNVLLVLGVLLGLGLPLAEAGPLLARLTPPPGRMQRFGGGPAPLVAVDYAHTPDGLEKALEALRAHCSGRLWCVFGCGGDRDRGKRPEMGAVAARLADECIVTDDNPRSEDPASIVADILAGVRGAALRVVHDRAAAIGAAVAAAAPGDAVLVAGKGHETVQIVGQEQRPFSDAAIVAAALARRAA